MIIWTKLVAAASVAAIPEQAIPDIGFVEKGSEPFFVFRVDNQSPIASPLEKGTKGKGL